MTVDFKNGAVQYLFWGLVSGAVCSLPVIVTGDRPFLYSWGLNALVFTFINVLFIEPINAIKYWRRKEQLRRYRYIWGLALFQMASYWASLAP